MRKLIFLFLIFACFAQAQSAKPAPAQAKPALGWCRLGTDPVDSSRQPDWAAECIIKVPATPVVMVSKRARARILRHKKLAKNPESVDFGFQASTCSHSSAR